ncbi:hypothetical protein C8Q80DRAFT_634853 [Daedaleopsis nitida]|nr:hypothetical protein C8Q80DRAFT_634853 [Daedaleopsis nitida]
MSTGGEVYTQAGGPVAPIATSPPIVELAQLVARIFAASYTLVSRTTIAVLLSLLAPISLLYSPIAYLLAPVFVFTSVILDVFVFTPYAIVVAVARNVYPIYVFVGCAAICAALIGFSARMLSEGIKRMLFGPRRPREEQGDDAPVPASEPKEKSAMKSSTAPKTRVRKRVSIKEERDR